MLTVIRIAPGAGVTYLTRQVATGRHDFRPTRGDNIAAYHADPTARGEAPGWWAGASGTLFGVQDQVTDEQIQLLIGEGKNPVNGGQLGRLWRQFQPMDDAARQAAVEKAWQALPPDATYEQIAHAWLKIWTAPDRKPVAGFDVTVSPVKSVSLLWAFGNDRVKQQVMAAHHAGVRATLAHLSEHGALTRLGTNGIVQVDTDGLAAMVFDHRMSREKDPQLHSHIIVSSKVRITKDGKQQWLSLDSRAFYQATVSARVAYERAVENELGRRLNVRFAERETSTIREIVGISPRALVHYSKRRSAIEAEMGHRTADPAGRRQPISVGRWRRRAQDATLRTRPDKEGGESTEQAVARWRREDRTADLHTAAEVRDVVEGRTVDDIDRRAGHVIERAHRSVRGRRSLTHPDLVAAAQGLGIDDDAMQRLVVNAAVRRIPHLAVEQAIRDVTADRAVFSIDHLELALGRILHVSATDTHRGDWHRVQHLAADAIRAHADGLRILTPPALLEWGDTLVRGSDRQSVYSRHRDLKLSTRSVLAAEHELITYATRRGAATAPAAVLDRVADDLDLSDEKRAALQFILGDDRRVTGVVGPAGTGKTYLQRAVGVAAQRAGVPVLGLTVGQNAAYVLAAATREGGQPGIRTENIAMWLTAQLNPPEGTDKADWSFQPGQWVIIDEASQASTHDLVRLIQLLEAVGGKLILVGDPAQVSAVGPGGMFRYLASLGNTTELRQVSRFTDAWEGPASLRLREGDTTVLAEYERRGRIISGDRDHLIGHLLDGWAADVIQGRTALIMVETEAEAADIAAQARRILIHAGIVQPGPTVTLANGTHAGVGDLVVTRRNNRTLLAGDAFVANRDQWRVLDIGPDGQLSVENTTTGHHTALPADYVAEHVQLAYAATVDSAQGRTVDVARALVDAATTLARLYVMATRGRLLNQIGVVTADEPPEGHPTEAPTAGVTLLADVLRADTTERSATETEQSLWANVDALHHWGAIYDDLTARASAPQYVAVIRRVAGPDVAADLAADPAMPALAARLQGLAAAGYDPAAVLAAVAAERELHSADDVAAVLAWRIDQTYRDIRPDPTVATSPAQTRSYTHRLPDIGGDLGDALTKIAAICDRRIDGLATLTAEHRPPWSSALGPVPDDEPGRRHWLAGAAVVVAYRDRYQLTGDDPIGPEPSHRDPARWGAWHRAQTVLGVATLTGQISAAPDTELRELVARQRAADRSAPDYAAGKLRVAHTQLIAAEQHLRDTQLTLASAQADATYTARTAARSTPRWWQAGPLATRAAATHAAANTAALRAGTTVADLVLQLDDARTRVTGARVTVHALEERHQTWTRWYTAALPTRYAGLAAAAETARRSQRLHTDAKHLADVVRGTVARVRAVDATRPRPHHQPVPDQLPEHAERGYTRTVDALDPPDTAPAEDTDLDVDHA